MRTTGNWQAWSVWCITAIFYAYEFFLRISPTVMKPELMLAYHTDAVGFSTLSASYYYAYALMQIPVGLITDRFHSKYVLTTALLIVAFGAYMLSMSHTLIFANMGRIFMGVGSAFAFTGCIKQAKLWFPINKIGFIVGLTNTIGVLGAILADTLFAFLLEHFDWRTLLLQSSQCGLILAIALYIVIRKSPAFEATEMELNSSISTILKDSKIWLGAIYGALLVAPISGFAELWSVPFLMESQHVTKPIAASLNSLIFVGIAIGGTLNGWLSTRIFNRKKILTIGTLAAIISFGIVVYIEPQSRLIVSLALFLFGYSTSNMLLIFAFNTQRYSHEKAGFIIALTNMTIMLVASLSQPILGGLISYLQHHYMLNRITEFQLAFSLLLFCQCTAILLTWYFDDPSLLNETSA